MYVRYIMRIAMGIMMTDTTLMTRFMALLSSLLGFLYFFAYDDSVST